MHAVNIESRTLTITDFTGAQLIIDIGRNHSNKARGHCLWVKFYFLHTVNFEHQIYGNCGGQKQMFMLFRVMNLN